jgi:shikimate kinase
LDGFGNNKQKFNMRIFVWGMPGAGKTTVGKQLAELLHLPFSDLDQLIQLKSGRTPAEWIVMEGEEVFRMEEKSMLLEWKPENGVLACGGGTPCFYNQYNIMNQQGITFWLHPSLNLIRKNLSSSKEYRPLLNASQEQHLAYLLGQREQHYAQARFTLAWEVDTSPKVLAQRMITDLQNAGLWLPSR